MNIFLLDVCHPANHALSTQKTAIPPLIVAIMLRLVVKMTAATAPATHREFSSVKFSVFPTNARSGAMMAASAQAGANRRAESKAGGILSLDPNIWGPDRVTNVAAVMARTTHQT